MNSLSSINYLVWETPKKRKETSMKENHSSVEFLDLNCGNITLEEIHEHWLGNGYSLTHAQCQCKVSSLKELGHVSINGLK